VDQRNAESVVVSESQKTAAQLCTVSANVPVGLASCVTLDWYRFHPPSRAMAYRSYYINRWRADYLSPSSPADQQKARNREAAEAAAAAERAAGKAGRLGASMKELLLQISKEAAQLEIVRRSRLET
jgi:hypothetical protein